MVIDGWDRRWPFVTGERPLAERSYEPRSESVSTAFAGTAAETIDVDPLSLPTLNDRIDPDAVDALVTEGRTGRGTGVRFAVEVSFGEVSVLLRDDGRLAIYADGSEPNGLTPPAVVEHDWSGSDSLARSIERAIAVASGRESTDCSSPLLDRFDVDALGGLLRPLLDGSTRRDSRLLLSVDGYEVAVSSSGSITVEPSLAVLKRAGAVLLVVGTLPEREFDRASATLLGDPDQARTPLFVLHGRDVATAGRRLSMAGLSPSAGTAVAHRAGARSSSSPQSPSNAPSASPQAPESGPRVVPVTGDIRALPRAVLATIEDGAVSSGALRLSVDSLNSMIESTDVETTRAVLEPLSTTVHDHRGIGHFLYAGDPDSEDVAALTPLVDAVVEVRLVDAGLEQRWRLTGTDHRTAWFDVA